MIGSHEAKVTWGPHVDVAVLQRAHSNTGSVDAVKLAIGISEALINTAGGLFVAIFSIVLYNVFVTMIDNFNYMMDEATLEVIEVLSIKEASK